MEGNYKYVTMSKIFSILLILVNLSAAGQKVIIRDSVTGQRYWLSVGALPVGSATTARLSDTASAGDIIQLWGSVSVLPTAGSAQVNDASIIAVKQY